MRHVWVLCLLVVSLSGCVQVEDVAKTRAANDFNCSADAVEVRNIGGSSFRAQGCGKNAVYNCAASDAYRGTTTDYTCVPESAPKGSTP